MGSTKIINVLKDDHFDELLDLFQTSQAKEVVFILPKRSKALNKEEHFLNLSEKANELDKTISILSSNPSINELAKKYKFSVLSGKKSEPVALETAYVSQDPLIHDDDDKDSNVVIPSDETAGIEHEEEPDENDGMHIEEESEEDEKKPKELPEEPVAELEYRPAHDYEVVAAVKRAPAKKASNPVLKKSKDDFDSIESVWRQDLRGTSVWTGILKKKNNFWSRFSLPNLKVKNRQVLSKKLISVLLGFTVLLLGTIVYVSTGSAQISIKPIEKRLTTPIKIEVSDSFSSIDPLFNKLPGQLLSIEKTIQQDFPATNKKEVAQKSRGKITVYNNYGTTDQTLIATTRFQSPSGLIFRTLKTIVVPGTKVENGQISPGTIDVEVIADKPGQGYNIGPTKFTIPAFKEKGDTNRYEKFYGSSTAAIAGGMIGISNVVSEADFNKAKEAVMAKLRQEVQDAAKAEAADLKIVDQGSVSIKNFNSTAHPDQATDQFTVTVTGVLKTVGFKESDLLSLISQSVEKGSNLVVLPDKIKLIYNDVAFSDAKNTLTFNVTVEGNMYSKINSEKLAADLAGLPETTFNDYLAHAQGVAHANVLLSPRWAKKMPKNSEKIKINVQY